MDLKAHIRAIPDFPKPGILFRDISTLLRDADAWQFAVERLADVTRALEYGSDRIEIQADAVHRGDRVVVVDDLLATGGTLAAGIALLRGVGAEVPAAAALIELSLLRGRDRLDVPFTALVAYDD